ncbi:MAG: lytic transglycosylase domain-containing protein [Candidatus Competibacteraceae bacterium]|nr:lytic transglycosylase domain-containing protein [Candidatus Competibacteraceae bacterium]
MLPRRLRVFAGLGLMMVCALCPLTTGVVLAGEPVPPTYREVARVYGIPAEVLYAVATVESNLVLLSGRARPWPWTLNVHGRGERYRTRLETWEAIQRHLAAGRRSIDIGLMQVNWRWHEDKLGNPWLALDPIHNLHVGARILMEQYRVSGDWLEAAGRYHSPANGRHAARYRNLVKRHLEKRGWRS